MKIPRFIAAIPLTLLGCAAPLPMVKTLSDLSQCPDLSGVFSEAGSRRYLNEVRAQDDAHLSWIILTNKKFQPTAIASLYKYSRSASGGHMVYFVSTIRASHPAAGRFELEALDSAGAVLGSYSFGAEDGWVCHDHAFIQESQYTSRGGADFTPGVDDRGIRILKRTGDGGLSISDHSTRQELSAFIEYKPVGEPRVSDSVEQYARVVP